MSCLLAYRCCQERSSKSRHGVRRQIVVLRKVSPHEGIDAQSAQELVAHARASERLRAGRCSEVGSATPVDGERTEDHVALLPIEEN